MHGGYRAGRRLRERLLPGSRMEGPANALVFASTDAAGAARKNMLKARPPAGSRSGPILMGMGNRAHIVTPSITARGPPSTSRRSRARRSAPTAEPPDAPRGRCRGADHKF